MLQDTFSFAQHCPSIEILSAFVHGNAFTEPMEVLTRHISECPQCTDSIAELERSDTIVQGLRHLRGGPIVRGTQGVATYPEPSNPRSTRQIDDQEECVFNPPGFPRRIGGYLLLDVLGQGAMGVVFRALQTSLNRTVAVKVARVHHGWNNEALVRFRTEVEALARVNSDAIVKIFDWGEEEGLPFFSMEYIPGYDLAHRLIQGPLEPREAVLLLQKLAQAVQAAHAVHVLHRDLKPANVLIGMNGCVKLTDFGLAKLLDAQVKRTCGGDLLGTAAYMSPEQAGGNAHQVGPGTDVYGLGAIFYEALTGKPPFGGLSRSEILHKVRTQDVQRPTEIRLGLCPELEAICLKCLAKNPDDRYPSAAAFSRDLERWLRGERSILSPLPQGQMSRRVALSAIGGVCCYLGTSLHLSPLSRDTGVKGPEIQPPVDPKRAERANDPERKLAQGQAVTLINSVGELQYPVLTIPGMDQPKFQTWREGFHVTSWELGLLELLRDTQNQAFHLSAEVWHLESSAPGVVGLYFARMGCGKGDTDGSFQYYIEFNYDDITATSCVNLRPTVCGTSSRTLPTHRMPGQGARCLKRAGRGLTTWRRLKLRVGRGEIQGCWEDFQFQQSLDMKELARQASISPSLTKFKINGKPFFSPRGGVGLFVLRGSASFRNVRIEPQLEI